MFQKVEWSEEYVSGNDELDGYHKKIMRLLNELVDMYDDTKTYMNEIPKKGEEFVSAIFEHFDVESAILRKYYIPEFEEHLHEHEVFKERIEKIVNYGLSATISSIAVIDIVCEYLLEHFQKYDKVHLPILNKKISEESGDE